MWRANKEVRGEVRNPYIYFSFAFAWDEEPEDLLAQASHEWHQQGSNMLKIKELQTFESKKTLCLFNMFTSVPKKTVLQEFCKILYKA